MAEWEILLLVYTGAFGLLMLVYWAWGKMKDMALAILECRGGHWPADARCRRAEDSA